MDTRAGNHIDVSGLVGLDVGAGKLGRVDDPGTDPPGAHQLPNRAARRRRHFGRYVAKLGVDLPGVLVSILMTAVAA